MQSQFLKMMDDVISISIRSFKNQLGHLDWPGQLGLLPPEVRQADHGDTDGQPGSKIRLITVKVI